MEGRCRPYGTERPSARNLTLYGSWYNRLTIEGGWMIFLYLLCEYNNEWINSRVPRWNGFSALRIGMFCCEM
jgi:hypothetical protein